MNLMAGNKKLWRENNRDRDRSYKRARSNTPAGMLGAARRRARRRGIEFDITADDIKIPTHCPVLGVRLTTEGLYSPSLDRVDSKKGYVRGNIVVVSWFVNRLKGKYDIKTLEQVVGFYRSIQ